MTYPRKPDGPGRGGAPAGRLRRRGAHAGELGSVLPSAAGPRAFVYLFGAGGLLALVTLLLPHAEGYSQVSVGTAALCAIAVASVLLFVRPPQALIRWLPVLGTALASIVIRFADAGAVVPYAGFYFWVVLTAFYLFDTLWAWFNTACVAVAFALVLGAHADVPDRLLAWVVVMGALSAAGAVIGVLRAQLEEAARHAQETLASSRRSERALAEAQRLAHIGSWEVNPETGRFRGSSELFRILGLDRAAVDTLDDVMAALDRETRKRLLALFRGSVDPRQEIELEYRLDLPTLGRRTFYTRARFIEVEAGRRVVGTTQDVTVARQQEERLQRTLKRLQATVDLALALGREPDPEKLLALVSERARTLLDADEVSIQLSGDGGAAAPAGDRGPLLRAPLEYRGVTHGVLVARRRAGEQEFSTGETEVLRAFATSAAVAVAGAKSVQADALRRSIDAAERERKRLARELHDQTLQSFGLLAMLLDSLPSSAGGSFEAAREAAKRVIDEEVEGLRRIIAGLREALLDDVGLVAALPTLAEKVSSEHGLPVRCDVSGVSDGLPPLAQHVEQTIYRVVQEALTNVVRHADATRADVTVRLDEEVLVAVVEDDGRGFDPSTGTGFGLAGMQERVSLLGGTLELDSRPGRTLVVARVPLRSDILAV